MTSKERHELRYQRRKAKREEKRRQRSLVLGTINDIFTYRNLFYYGKKCCNNTRWKQSVQNFELHLFSGTAGRRQQLLENKWVPKKYKHFVLSERGKTRPIDAPHVTDRQVEKVLTNKVLYPLYHPSMIYDNGASQSGKGTHFHYRRLKQHLREHYRRHGRNGVIILIDFHQFFPTASHEVIYQRHKHFILDYSIRAVADSVISSVPGDYGLPLGVEPSQAEMVALPSALDNYIKCQLSIHGAGHYMDDYYMIIPNAEDAPKILESVIQKATTLGLHINRRKCHIVPLTRPFRFCKIKFYLSQSGKIITHGCRDGMKRARRKLRHFQVEVQVGRMSVADVEQWLQGQIAYYNNYNDHGRVLKLRRLFYAMFIRKD